MRASFFIAVLFLPLVAIANGLDDYLSKVKKVIEQDGRCVFAAADVPDEAANRSAWPREVVCVGDITIGAGTSEHSGCAAFNLDVNSLSATLLGVRLHQTAMIDGSKCENVFEQLMAQDLYPKTVGAAFYSSIAPNLLHTHPAVIYAKKSLFEAKSKYEAWFDKARAEYLADLAKKKQQQNSGGGK